MVNTSCELWNDHLMLQNLTTDACLDMRDQLTRQCCEGLPPLYECETSIEELLLGKDSSYNSHRAPIVNSESLDIDVFAEVFGADISDNGVEGGKIKVFTSLFFSWVDERLQWNSTLSSACPSVSFDWENVWVPQLEIESSETPVNIKGKVKVFANGLVFWEKSAPMLLTCNAAQTFSKHCEITFFETRGDTRLKYIVNTEMNGTNGIVMSKNTPMPKEYQLDTAASKLSTEETSTFGVARQNLLLEIALEPLRADCNICGDEYSKLHESPRSLVHPKEWLDLHPDTFSWNCDELDNLLTNTSVSTKTCYIGRASFEEPCCDDIVSNEQCERNIHDSFIEKDVNTVTPPDPSTEESEGNARIPEDDRVDVQVSLDVAHLIDVDIKVNSLQLLVSLELSWYDSNLAFYPFLGGCHHVSYRASHDAELTEIWVPQIELINKLEGVSSLPDSFASVRYDGHVVWRRTGVLEGACELGGIEQFPYDTADCVFEFGGTRDPLYDRVNYYFIEGQTGDYSDRISDNEFDFQEYRLITDKTKVCYGHDTISGFTRKIIVYKFFFDRARNYYIVTFVVIYILLTYLAMGSFFVDYGGERLGYGSSVLFVIVAQDITLIESIPVTNSLLWINNLSLISKIFSILTILQSIVVLYIYNYKDFEEDQYNNTDMSGLVFDNKQSIDPGASYDESTSTSRNNTDMSGLVFNNNPSIDPGASHDKSTSTSRKRKKRFFGVGWIAKTVLRHRIDGSDAAKTRKIKILKSIDFTSFCIFSFSYSAFLVWLFSKTHFK